MMLNRSTTNGWTNQIKYVLYHLNLSEYWENQLVENEINFLYIVESKLIEISDNKWSACIAIIDTVYIGRSSFTSLKKITLK